MLMMVWRQWVHHNQSPLQWWTQRMNHFTHLGLLVMKYGRLVTTVVIIIMRRSFQILNIYFPSSFGWHLALFWCTCIILFMFCLVFFIEFFWKEELSEPYAFCFNEITYIWPKDIHGYLFTDVSSFEVICKLWRTDNL